MKNKEKNKSSEHIQPDETFIENVSVGQFAKEIMQLDEQQRKELIAFAEHLMEQK